MARGERRVILLYIMSFHAMIIAIEMYATLKSIYLKKNSIMFQVVRQFLPLSKKRMSLIEILLRESETWSVYNAKSTIFF